MQKEVNINTELTKEDIDKINLEEWNKLRIGVTNSVKETENIISIAKELDYDKGIADASLNKGLSLYFMSSYQSSYSWYIKALEIYKKIYDNHGTCKVLNAIGIYYHAISRLDKALEYYKECLEIAKKYSFKDRILASMDNVGELYLEMENPKEALTYLIPAYHELDDCFSGEFKADLLRNIGHAFYMLGNIDLAREYTQEAYKITLETGKYNISADVLEIMTKIAIADEDFVKADEYVTLGLQMVQKSENLYQKASLLCIKASILISQNEPEKALEVLSKSENICKMTNLKVKLYKVYEQQSKARELQGKYKEALERYQLFANLKAEIQNEETSTKLYSMQAWSEIEQAKHNEEIYRLKNIELHEKTSELKSRNRQIFLISQLGKQITANFSFNAVIETVYNSLKPIFKMDMFGIALEDDDKQHLIYKQYYDEGHKKHNWRVSLDSETSFATWCFTNRKPVFISEKSQEMGKYLNKPSTQSGLPCESIVFTPLIIQNRVLGVLTVQSYKAKAFDNNDINFLESLSPYICIAIENTLIHERLENMNKALSSEKRRLERATMRISHLANHDSLTSLPNRRLLFELMERSIEVAKRSNSMVGVIYLDLDKFKPINDQFGHAAGDSALITVSERIKSVVRASDIVARIGGDEFIVVITNVKSRQNVETVAEKIKIEGSKPMTFDNESFSVGISTGISMFPENGAAIEELINKADAAMYLLKNHTR